MHRGRRGGVAALIAAIDIEMQVSTTSGVASMYVSHVRYGPLAKIVPPAKPSPFDQAIFTRLDTSVGAVRTNAASEAASFLDAPPVDPAKPLGTAGRI